MDDSLKNIVAEETLTTEKAQFILQSFRPNGADTDDNSFKEALHLAAKDKQLGEWLVAERAADTEFAEALQSVEIPQELRLQILAVMHGDTLDDPEAEVAMDGFLQGAMIDIQPPAGLRNQIIAAMDIERSMVNVEDIVGEKQNQPNQVNSSKKSFWNFTSSAMAIAAAVMLGAILAFNIKPSLNKGEVISGDTSLVRISSYDVQKQAADFLNTSFELDVKKSDQTSLNTWLVSNQLPVPSDLPAGLDGMKPIGCKMIPLSGGAQASLICFLEDNGGMVHVVVVNSKALADTTLPILAEVNLENCYHCKKTGWGVARWHDDTNSYIMMAKVDVKADQAMLRYF